MKSETTKGLTPDESREYEIRHCERGVSFFGPNIGNLFAKLSKVLGAVSRVPKRGHNDFHKYDYAMESDLVDAIRPKLAEEGMAIVFGAGTTEHHPYQTAKGKPAFLTTVTAQVVIGDSEGNVIVLTTSGVGSDEGDKGAYKAMTGAVKYFLMKSFLVSTGDDPEQDNGRATAPVCRCGGPMEFVAAGKKENGEPYPDFWRCENPDCKDDKGKRHAIKDADWQALLAR